jgi:hypothetical protein
VRRLAFLVLLIGALGFVSCGEEENERESVEDLLNQAF